MYLKEQTDWSKAGKGQKVCRWQIKKKEKGLKETQIEGTQGNSTN